MASYSLNVTWNTLIGPNRLNKGSLISAPVAGTNQVTLTYPPGVGDRTLIEADEVGGQQQRFFAYATPPSTVTIDFSAQPVPKISALQQTHTGATWTQTAGSADVRTVIWRAQAHGGPVTWTVTEPNDGLASTTLPAIPAAESAIDPTTDLSSNALASGIAILYDDYDVVSGYALFPPTTDYQQHRSHLELSGNHPFP